MAVHLTSCLATLVITTLVLYVTFPVSRTEICHDSSFDLVHRMSYTTYTRMFFRSVAVHLSS